MAGLVALSMSLIGGLAHAADADRANPVTPPARAFILQPSVELQETYTDNVALTPSDKASDLITRILLSLDATLDTGRSEGHLGGAVGYDIYARQSFRDGFYAIGTGAASYALVPDLLTLKADASTSDGAVSTFGYSATDRHGASNLAQLTTYDVGPELTGRTPDGLDVKAAARFAQVFYSNASSGPLLLPRDDSIGQLIGEVATDATRRLQLESSEEYLRDTQDFSSLSAIQSAYFRVSAFRLIGRVGYDDITQRQLLHISAPLGSIGFEYKPNSDSTITVEAGDRYHRPTWSADATIELSPRLLATASYLEQVQPDQVGVARSFFAFTQATQNLPPPLVPAYFGVPADVTNLTSFARSAMFRGLYHDDANTLEVTANWTDRKYLTIPGRDRTLVMDAAFTRRMRPDLSIMLHADYGYTPQSPTYGASTAVGGSIQLAYRLNSRTDVTLNFTHIDSRQLVQNGERVTENALFETLRRTF